MTTQTHPHPEWKRLFSSIAPLIGSQELFTYEELRDLAGIDVRSGRGRSQFHKFQRQALNELGVWFECERTVGYRVTKPVDHPRCAMSRVYKGRRQMRRALAISIKTREDGASAAVITAKRQIAASVGAILQASDMETSKVRPLLLDIAKSDPSETLNAILLHEGKNSE